MKRHPEIIAVDPGIEAAAYVVMREGIPVSAGSVPRHTMGDMLRATHRPLFVLAKWRLKQLAGVHRLMPVLAGYMLGAGRVPIDDIKGHLIGSYYVEAHLVGEAATWREVRRACWDRYGGRMKALGTERRPGILYNIPPNGWWALGLGVLVSDWLVQSPYYRQLISDRPRPIRAGEIVGEYDNGMPGQYGPGDLGSVPADYAPAEGGDNE